MSNFDFSGMLALQKQTKRMEREFSDFLREFLLKQGVDAMNRAKENTSVDTGLLRAAWTLEGVKREGNRLIVTLSNPIAYASYVEYGHRQEVGRYVPAIGKRLKQPWVEGQFMATLAIEEVAALIPGRFQTEFKAWATRLGAEVT